MSKKIGDGRGTNNTLEEGVAKWSIGPSSSVSGNSPCYRKPPSQGSKPPDGSMHFSITKHQKEIFDQMNNLRQTGDLCDINLIAGNSRFPCHKMVLASASPYFRGMFCRGMMECGMTDITLQNVKPNILATLLEFIYTAELHVSEMNVCSLLPAATMFDLSHVVDACSIFLEHQFHPSNCIGIADFAQTHGCHDLHNKAKQYLFANFKEVYLQDEWMQLSQTQLMQIIKRDEINVQCESDVYLSVMKWVMYEPCKRLPRLECLLSGVRCHFLTPGFLKEQLKYSDILKKMPKCHEYLRRISDDLVQHRWVKIKRRCPLAPPVLYVIGGYLRHSLTNVECFNPQTKEWYKLCELPMPRSGLSATNLHGLLYVLGGRNNSPMSNEDSASMDCYDPLINMWKRCADMTVPRHRVGSGSIDGLLYAVGGSNGSEHHCSVERYDPSIDKWTLIKPMKSKRIGVGVAVANRLLYAIGGYNGSTRLNTVECYHPEMESWIPIASMNTPRSGAGVICLDQYIYVAGGFDSVNQLDSVERFDIETSQWEVLTSMLRPRSAFGIAAIDDKIYAVGGYDGNDFLNTVESYDPEEDHWKEEVTMSCGRSGPAVVVGIEPCLNANQHELIETSLRSANYSSV